MFRFPFYVSFIGGTNDILFLVMIEDQSIIFMFDVKNVFLEEKLGDIEFFVCQSEKIFELDWNSMRLYS